MADVFGGLGGDQLAGGETADRIYGAGGDDRLVGGAGDDALWGDGDGAAAGADVSIPTTLIASDLSNPLFVTAPEGDLTRLFVVEQTGAI